MNQESEEKITIGNVCFIRDQATKRVLLLKRHRDPMKNLYTGVGGKTNFFEDIRASCFREIKEEMGLTVTDLKCNGILKTILDGKKSSWILFVYTANSFTGSLINCDEGELKWVPYDDVFTLPVIGFIREILPQVLFEDSFIEGTAYHDLGGNVCRFVKS